MWALLKKVIGAVTMSEIVELPRLSRSRRSALDGLLINENCNVAQVSLEVFRIRIRFRQLRRCRFDVVFGRGEMAMSEPLLQIPDRHRFPGVIELRGDSRSGAVARDRPLRISFRHTSLTTQHRDQPRIEMSRPNTRLIPMLCRKAGVPETDAQGPITSHRARSTITTQLYNAREPMSIWDLKEWLGHRHLSSTEHYVKPTPTKLAKSYSDAEYFKRNLRHIAVLVDQEAIKSGAAASGEAWKFYDLGHGYCAYDFFEQCPHRMACAKCSFYVPKESSRAQLLEAKTNLLRMMQEIPLQEEERAAVEERHPARVAHSPLTPWFRR